MYTPIAIVPARYVANTQTTQYIAANTRTRIDKFTLTNVSANNQTVSVNLVPNGSTATIANAIIKDRQLAPNEAYTCPEMIGQYLNPGDAISTIASNPSTVVIRVSGSEYTS
jgi:archaellum component FlaF (FlaF/FlaG flagellin family)